MVALATEPQYVRLRKVAGISSVASLADHILVMLVVLCVEVWITRRHFSDAVMNDISYALKVRSWPTDLLCKAWRRR
jgi:hypothetical protein